VPLLLIWAPTWGWVMFANVLLGVNQGLAWSVTVIMKIDLVGPTRRGTAMGFNEAAGYGAVAVAAWATGAIAESAGLRPAPFLLGLAFAALGLGLSGGVRPRDHRARRARGRQPRRRPRRPRRRPHRPAGLRAGHLARPVAVRRLAGRAGEQPQRGHGLGAVPDLFALGGLDLATVGLLTAIAPAVWGVGQLGTGALSDRIGRKWLIAGGQLTEAAGLLVIALGDGFEVWAVGSAMFGAGTAMAYPTLIAAVGDVAHPTWRGAAVGVYRLWRDIGFAVGAVLAGVLADAYSITVAIVVVAAITAASGSTSPCACARPTRAAPRRHERRSRGRRADLARLLESARPVPRGRGVPARCGPSPLIPIGPSAG
jgi:MFS family permease